MDAYEAIRFIYRSYVLAQPHLAPGLLDIYKRHPQYCRRLLQGLGLDLTQPPTVLITGSKGKGSTSAILASVIQAMGYKVGLFTGPHLVDFCDRVRLNWRKIPEADLVRLASRVRPHVEQIQGTIPAHHYLGPVGIVLAIALLWFREQGTDYHVLECGRGALADDVNVVAGHWSALTPIMFEHAGSLGPTLLDIAANKISVVKSGQKHCVSCRQDPEVERLVKSLCRVAGVPLKLEGEDYSVRVVETGPAGSIFAYRSSRRQSAFCIPLAGRFQVMNAGVAIALAEEIVPEISDSELAAGLSAARWPGRCQLLPGSPPIILDGTINARSAEYLRELLQIRKQPVYLVLGVPADKDWPGVLSKLAPGAEAVWLTEASNNSLVFPASQAVLAEAKKYNPCCKMEADVTKALASAVREARGRGTVVVAGTLSLIRDANIFIQSQLGRDTGE